MIYNPVRRFHDVYHASRPAGLTTNPGLYKRALGCGYCAELFLDKFPEAELTAREIRRYAELEQLLGLTRKTRWELE